MIYVRVLSFNSVELTRNGAGINTGVKITKSHADVLLSAGDILKLTPDIFLHFGYYRRRSEGDELDDIQRAEAKCFADEFHLAGRRLGVGGQASVFVAVKQSNKQQFACKAVPLPLTQYGADSELDSDMRMTAEQKQAKLAARKAKLARQREDLAREYNILKALNHPNIIALEKVICATYDVFIFQELITGGDLLSYMDQKGLLDEPQAAVIVFQIVKAVEYLHANGVVHRDIKPENILMTSWNDGGRVVLTDFGQARTINDSTTARNGSSIFRMQTIVGTYGYTAPEIFKQMKRTLPSKGYSKAIDMWSVGCVAATLLTSELVCPQDDADVEYATSSEPIHEKWNVNDLDERPLWAGISRKAKDFVKRCLAPEESMRMTASEALSSGWLTNKHYQKELQAVYDLSIADWKPRKQTGDLIMFLDTTAEVARSSLTGEVLSGEVTSKHFQKASAPVAMPPPAPRKAHPSVAATHQPPALPAMSRAAKASSQAAQSSPPQAYDPFSFASPVKATNFQSSFTPYINQGTAPLSIYNYLPPQTQSQYQTAPPLSLHGHGHPSSCFGATQVRTTQDKIPSSISTDDTPTQSQTALWRPGEHTQHGQYERLTSAGVGRAHKRARLSN